MGVHCKIPQKNNIVNSGLSFSEFTEEDVSPMSHMMIEKNKITIEKTMDCKSSRRSCTVRE